MPPDFTEEFAYLGEQTVTGSADENGLGPQSGSVVTAAGVLDRAAVPPETGDANSCRRCGERCFDGRSADCRGRLGFVTRTVKRP
jgi:hypothetical protein